ncbi:MULTISPECIES: hydrogenase maturation nickel metallochaperone HypA [Deefgea]|uniref:Hydrogenase maturation factor HypA n=1 Tax=Deefgea chitinilytica TaxID=570276 RepID=A0ABS2C9Z0_9NEIS|nr:MULTISPECIES: hydrogenase maturation nickel metallochaperone HypA [Deefgea]MBM5570961.1 hydrogenase maturation nickel metallochaperone HypA [Deefgea chitinilytica]MBM9888191.1 hydrogenase maturation nickel metallochaperone HypA [Deefgea sp. CFH1-16]
MHELSLAENVIRIVESAAKQSRAQRVTRVRLAIGVLAHVDADTLQFCCGLAARQTMLEGAEFSVERTQGQAHCNGCEQNVVLERVGIPCPRCGSFDLQVIAGEEMQVLDISIS